MRFFKRKNGYYYFEIGRGNPVSLKTKDKLIAQKAFKRLEQEIALLRVYKTVYQELKKAKREIENHFSETISTMEKNSFLPILERKELKSKYGSEEEMQAMLLPSIRKQFGLKNIQEYYKCKNGIVDVLCDYENQKIILEFKLNKLSEKNLGQCLRYLNDNGISADQIWLIGESAEKTTGVFKSFSRIKLFITTKSDKAKYMIRPFNVKH